MRIPLTTMLFAAVLTAAVGFGGVQTFLLNRATDKLQTQEAAMEAAAKKYTADLLEQERVTSQRIMELQTNHLNTQQAANDEYQIVLADLAATRLKLRDRFTCPKPPAGTPGTAPGSDGEAPTGLLTEDVQFLVSEAKRSDDVVRQLTLAPVYITILQMHYD